MKYYDDCSTKCETPYKDNCRNRTAVTIPANASCSTYFADCSSKCSAWNCASGYELSNNICKAQRASCSIGWIYYSDGTCSAPNNYTASKTVLGVVVYANPEGVGGQVMTIWPIDKNGNRLNGYTSVMKWSESIEDIPNLKNYGGWDNETDFSSCKNTDEMIAYDGNKATAALAARNYAPTLETKGKWCVPASGITTVWYRNKTVIDDTIKKLGGVPLGGKDTDYHHWSSTENCDMMVFVLCANNSGDVGWNPAGKLGEYYLRPVLEF